MELGGVIRSMGVLVVGYCSAHQIDPSENNLSKCHLLLEEKHTFRSFDMEDTSRGHIILIEYSLNTDLSERSRERYSP